MKRFFIAVILIVCYVSSHAQSIIGNWEGAADVGGQKLKAVFHIAKENDQYTVSFDSPDQHAFGLRCDGLTISGDSLSISMKVIGGSYKGKWNGADDISGNLLQGGQAFILPLKKVSSTVAAMPAAKPQTPKGPFNYIIQEVEYENTLQHVHLGATLTKPLVGTKFPVVLMITGSGPQDRDETIGMHKPFWVIADYLTRHGIAVLRVDDRGIGKSTGNFAGSTSADFATDVMAGIDYLKTRRDVDVTKIGLMGHSEGGMIAPYVAARDKDVAFIVTLAGSFTGGRALNDFQNTLPMERSGASKEMIASFLQLHHALVADAVAVNTDAVYNEAIQQTYFDWKKTQTPEMAQSLIKGQDANVITELQKNYTAFRNPWWRFVFSYDPATDLQKLNIPALALNGEKDEQVEPKADLAVFNEALKKSNSKSYKSIEIPGVNHLFQHCKACGSIPEYLALDETFDPATLAIICDWIKEQIK